MLAASWFYSLLFLVAAVGSFHVPVWSDNYRVRGTLYVPDAKVVEPFEIWYSRALNGSRADFYDGMVRTYQTLEGGEFGTEYKIVPYTTETLWNVRRCFRRAGTETEPVELQPALYPIEDMFEFVGNVTEPGGPGEPRETLQKWSRVEYVAANETITYHFYTKCSPVDCNRPVRLEMNGLNLIFPSHAGHYFIEYESYEPDVVTHKMLDIRRADKCDDLNDYARTPSFSTMRDYLPGISRVVREDRGFARFTRTFGTRFKSKTEFRNLLVKFRRDVRKLKLRLKKKLERFAARKPLDFGALNKRIRNDLIDKLNKLRAVT